MLRLLRARLRLLAGAAALIAPAIAEWGAARTTLTPDDTLRLAADVQQYLNR